MKYRCANNATWKVNNTIFNALVLLSIMYANETHGGVSHIDPSNFLLANNCSFLPTQLFTKSENTDYLNCIFLYCHSKWETVTEIAKSLETANG